MKKAIFSLCIILFLTSCSTNPFSGPTSTPTLPPTKTSTSTSTPEPTATATITPSPTPDLPTSWDDPEVIARIRADFEKSTGMSVENYYNQALKDKRVSDGGSESYFIDKPYVSGAYSGILVGTCIVATENGKSQHLVLYYAQINNDKGVGIYPLDIAFEKNGSFTQTSIGNINRSDNPNPYFHKDPIYYDSIEEAQIALNQEIGTPMLFALLVRFKNLESCTLPQNAYLGNVPEDFWKHIGYLCQTPGNYINGWSQEPTKTDISGYARAWTYNPDQLMEKGVPDSGLIAIIIGIRTEEEPNWYPN